MEDNQQQEVDALCPECGHGFKAHMDRVLQEEPHQNDKAVDCPVCGCGGCKIGS